MNEPIFVPDYLGDSLRGTSETREGGLHIKIVFPEPTAPFTTEPMLLADYALILGAEDHTVPVQDDGVHPSTDQQVEKSGFETTETAEDMYAKLNDFIDKRAAEFFGMHALSLPLTGRMRLLHKAIKEMPVLDAKTAAWVNGFDAERATKLGDAALHTIINVPVPPVETVHEDGNKSISDWSSRKTQVIQVFRYPKVRTQLLAELEASDNSMAIVISRLEAWREKQIEKPKQVDIIAVQRCYEQALFAAHGIKLSKHVEKLIAEQYNDLDIHA